MRDADIHLYIYIFCVAYLRNFSLFLSHLLHSETFWYSKFIRCLAHASPHLLVISSHCREGRGPILPSTNLTTTCVRVIMPINRHSLHLHLHSIFFRIPIYYPEYPYTSHLPFLDKVKANSLLSRYRPSCSAALHWLFLCYYRYLHCRACVCHHSRGQYSYHC